MDILHQFEDVPTSCRRSVLALGNFDGIHRGHRAVLQATQKIAGGLGVPAGVLTFDPHPRQFFHPEEAFFQLSSVSQKLEAFETLGLNLAVILPFKKKLASLTAKKFVEKVLVDGLGVSHIVTGYNFYFGKGREGTPQMMQDLAASYGFQTTVIAAEGKGDEVYSSSQIRADLSAGDVRTAAEKLGGFWSLEGNIIHGRGVGKSLGFATANMALDKGQALKHGIYAVRGYFDGKCQPGVAYLGRRPTFDSGRERLEIFLFDFNEDLYGKTVKVELIDFIRDDQSFDKAEELVTQMTKDSATARDILANLEKRPVL